MKKLLAGVLMVLASVSSGYANPVVDPEAEMEHQTPLRCPNGDLILRYDFEGGDKGYWVVFKEPNAETAGIVVYFEPNTDSPSKFYVYGQEIAREQLPAHPCDVFVKS